VLVEDGRDAAGARRDLRAVKFEDCHWNCFRVYCGGWREWSGEEGYRSLIPRNTF
jgi:hypothetical protein